MSEQGKIRNQKGRFVQKSEEPRQIRSIIVTDSTWKEIGRIAELNKLTRADIIEKIFNRETSKETTSKQFNLEQIKKAVEEILEDKDITRNGRDKSAIRKGLQALINKLR